jgi:hypothetical protein
MISKLTKTWLNLALILSVASKAVVADVPPGAQVTYLTYDDAVKIALKDNVDLLALREQEDSYKALSRQALAPNEPTFSWQKADIPTFSLTQTPAQNFYEVSWTLGFPGKALSNSASIRHQAEGMSEQARTQEINILTRRFIKSFSRKCKATTN